MCYSHPKNCKLIWFASQGGASGNHIRQLCDISRHFVAPAALNFAMVLPTTKLKSGGQQLKTSRFLHTNGALPSSVQTPQIRKTRC